MQINVVGTFCLWVNISRGDSYNIATYIYLRDYFVRQANDH